MVGLHSRIHSFVNMTGPRYSIRVCVALIVLGVAGSYAATLPEVVGNHEKTSSKENRQGRQDDIDLVGAGFLGAIAGGVSLLPQFISSLSQVTLRTSDVLQIFSLMDIPCYRSFSRH